MREFLVKRQYIVARGLLEESGRVLIVRSPKGPMLEYYEFPGGYVEFGKDPADALADFFFEQTRIPVSVEAPLRTTSRISSGNGEHIVEIVYRVRSQKRINVEQRAGTSVLWIVPDDVGFFLSSHISETIHLGLNR